MSSFYPVEEVNNSRKASFGGTVVSCNVVVRLNLFSCQFWPMKDEAVAKNGCLKKRTLDLVKWFSSGICRQAS